MEVPETKYVETPDGVNIAYQVVGEGPTDLVFIPGWISNLDLFWELAAPQRFFERLASFARLIIFDKRGTGLSDPIDEAATLETRMDDLRAVMDAAGSERAAICGYSEGGSVAALFAATFPDRTSRLLLLHAPIDPERSTLLCSPAWREIISREWGQGALMDFFVPNHSGDPRAKNNWAQSQRRSASRAMALKYYDLMRNMDASAVLPNVRVPTLVMTREDDPVVGVDSVRDCAAAIPGARLVELPGNDHLVWLGDWESVTDEIEEFVTGEAAHHEPDRVLATVLFTDIVSSTEQASALGDQQWRELLEEHDAISRRMIDRHHGRVVKSTGDGLVATFDGPARAIRAACSMRDALDRLGLEIRAGLHTGECELIGDDIGGLAVHIASRVSSMAGSGDVLVSRTVKDLVAGSGVAFEDRGEHSLKGVPETWRLYAVAGA